MIIPEDVIVQTLGEPRFDSPLDLSIVRGDGKGIFVPDEARVRFQVELFPGEEMLDGVLFEKAGPRQYLYFNPGKTKAAIVICGGLCPGINNVVRSLFLELYHNYGVKEVLGIKYGFRGLIPKHGVPPVVLTLESVKDIHKEGGSILGSSRGRVDLKDIVDFLDYNEIDILFCIGGEGTQKGAHAIANEIKKQNKKISIVGIPKTIDNDIRFAWKTFGFSTDVEKAKEVLECTHNEANGAITGIWLVKLMGRNAGVLASAVPLARQEVNFTLIPEVPFELEGENGLLNTLKKRILLRGHAVIVVAEGAGQELIPSDEETRDESGNIKHKDIGVFLAKEISKYFDKLDIEVTLKYFDPSYIIRSVAANGDDSLFCDSLARQAVHAAMAGKTNVLIGIWHNVFINVPIASSIAEKKCMSPESALWTGLLEATGQPRVMLT